MPKSARAPRVAALDRAGHRVGRFRLAAGVAVLAAAGVVLAIALRPGDVESSSARGRVPALAPEYAGTVTDWILCASQRERAFFEETQAEILAKARKGIRLHVFTPSDDAERSLRKVLADRGLRNMGHVAWQRADVNLWPWVRDTFVAGRDADGSARAFVPEGRFRDRGRPLTHKVDMADLVRRARGRATAVDAPLEGGAFLVAEDRVLVSEGIARQAIDEGVVANTAQLRAKFESLWGLPVEFLPTKGASRSAHCDLLAMPVGGRRVVLGSPRLAAELLHEIPATERARFLARVRRFGGLEPGWPGNETLRKTDDEVFEDILKASHAPGVSTALERVRTRLEALGYRCLVVPYLCMEPPAPAMSLVISYTNVVLDEHEGKRTVYLPVCGIPTLDRSGIDVWKKLGYEVVTIDALGPALCGGGVRCLSQTFRR